MRVNKRPSEVTNAPLDIGVLRDDISLQGFNQVFVFSSSVELLHLRLRGLGFVLELEEREELRTLRKCSSEFRRRMKTKQDKTGELHDCTAVIKLCAARVYSDGGNRYHRLVILCK